jgi:anti-anti-sigma regulatory factor
MSRDGIESIKGNRFSAQVSTSDRRFQINLTGTADLLVSGQLDALLRQVHLEAQRFPAEEVTVDVRELEFMNSSCLKSFVR